MDTSKFNSAKEAKEWRNKELRGFFDRISKIADDIYMLDYPMHKDTMGVYHKLIEAKELMRKVR